MGLQRRGLAANASDEKIYTLTDMNIARSS